MRCIIPLSIALLLVPAGPAQAQEVPSKLVPPSGSVESGKYPAKGVQIYVCSQGASGMAWTFKAPEAALVDAQNRPVAKHYAGPTWEAPDGSKVVGKVVENAPSPRPGAIPWLLLSGESSGAGVFAGTKYIQRLNTAGGVAPAGACQTANAESRIDYTADYVFFK